MVPQQTDNPLEFAVAGAGFWAQYQVAAWGEVPGVRCIAVVDRDLERARDFCRRFGIAEAYPTLEAMFAKHRPDFVDIITTPESHAPMVLQVAEQRTDAICQKPLAESLESARSIARACEQAGVMLSVHENWRWQRPIRQLKQLLNTRPIGKIFRARIDYNNSFPVFDNQPNLKELDEFILSDMGPHLFDIVRFLFGEPQRLYCQINQSRTDIRGEDVASAMMRMEEGVSLTCNMSYASRMEHDRFPETLLVVEGDSGSVALDNDYWISVTTEEGTVRRRFPPTHYDWLDPRYAVVHSSMVECQRHLAESMRSRTDAETSAADNLKTLEIIDAAYRSARSHRVIELNQ